MRRVTLKTRLDTLGTMVQRLRLIRDESEHRLWKSVIDARIKILLADGVEPATITAIVPWYANIPEAE